MIDIVHKQHAQLLLAEVRTKLGIKYDDIAKMLLDNYKFYVDNIIYRHGRIEDPLSQAAESLN